MSSKRLLAIALIWIVFGVVLVAFLIQIGTTNPDAPLVYLVSAAILFVVLIVIPATVLLVRYAYNRRVLQVSGDPDDLGSTRFVLVIPQLEQPLTQYCAATQATYCRSKRLIFTTSSDSFLLFAVEHPSAPMVRVPWASVERIVSSKPPGIHGPARRVIVVAIRHAGEEYRLPLVLATAIGTTFVPDAVVDRLLAKLNAHLQ